MFSNSAATVGLECLVQLNTDTGIALIYSCSLHTHSYIIKIHQCCFLGVHHQSGHSYINSGEGGRG